MRHLLLVLMIALMPMRGWAGDLMAVEMATQRVAVTDGNAAAASALHADCAGHSHAETAAATDSAEPQDVHAGAHCNTCIACQVCSSTALVVQTGLTSVSTVSHGVPPIAGAAFTSAEPAPGFKPPIS